eukprot:CAMPEP_0183789132 /NCGR_PEP_ID=MMETSP0803_2-20130417/226_1 /TAXON_ID=195967 /ORGANISM="Crustomastix stigmata, Strain CCMP3273" /LENGTH=55 /DNA_ID=CAMNT_0026033293 /DNA_START=34 /DNA_END=201 /DNA_ORIENTATION=+
MANALTSVVGAVQAYVAHEMSTPEGRVHMKTLARCVAMFGGAVLLYRSYGHTMDV